MRCIAHTDVILSYPVANIFRNSGSLGSVRGRKPDNIPERHMKAAKQKVLQDALLLMVFFSSSRPSHPRSTHCVFGGLNTSLNLKTCNEASTLGRSASFFAGSCKYFILSEAWEAREEEEEEKERGGREEAGSLRRSPEN